MKKTILLLAPLALALLGATSPTDSNPKSVSLKDANGMVSVTIDGKDFTTYRYAQQKDDPKFLRPYLWPVTAIDGTEVTSDQWRLSQKEKTDHPHHRSIWVGWGDVNGTDHWTGKTWQQRHVKFDSLAADSIVEELTWDGKTPADPVLTEKRTIRFIPYADGSRGIEITSELTAPNADAVFKCQPLTGNSVEAGLCAVRVAKDVSKDPNHLIESSAGVKGEKESRDKPAAWCDYSGTINGKIYGIAMVNGPKNPGGDTPWHVRDQGLFAHIGQINWTLPKGQSVTIKHLIIIHDGNATQANIDAKAKAWRSE